MHALIVEAGKLMLTSKSWPARDIPPALRGKIEMGKTSVRGFRTATVTLPSGKQYQLIESNPAKVGLDSDGNTAKSKVMVKEVGKDGWVGQVRKYLRGIPSWHFHAFTQTRRGA